MEEFKALLQKFHPKKKTIIIAVILAVMLIIAAIYDLVQYNKRTYLDTSHVFVCDDAEHYSEFDNWLFDNVGVDRVPVYLIIYNNNIIGKIDGNIPEELFTDELETILAEGKVLQKLPEYQISNITGDKMSLIDIAKKHTMTILEISWVTCQDCIEQDNNFTKAIYNKYSTEHMYRYYVKSEMSAVAEKHK